jgi:hypothetical protein
VKEHPILFSGAMVRAILAGQITQTRRVCNPQPVKNGAFWELYGAGWSSDTIPVPVMPDHSLAVRGPFGCAGDRLWVRESWSTHAAFDLVAPRDLTARSIHYWADGEIQTGRRRPGMFMPRWACRILLEITDVRVQRLVEISHDDADAEGCPGRRSAVPELGYVHTPREQFAQLWDSINAERAPWDSNPWVWAITFRRVDQ